MKTNEIQDFEKLYKDLQPRLFAYCYKFVEDLELSKDIVQECFFSFWNHRKNIESPASYLFRSVHNRCKTHFRQLKVQQNYHATLDIQLKDYEIHPTVSNPLINLYLSDVGELLEVSINKMPPRCKEVFEMSRLKGLQNKEIAEALNISIRTVETQIYNALKILKEDLKDYLPFIVHLFWLLRSINSINIH